MAQPAANTDSTRENGQNLEEKAYVLIREGLLKGLYPPGYRMVERDIADRLGMSRTPVRWALRQMEAEGYLDRQDSRGFSVKMPGHAEALRILDVRTALEGMAARLAARNRTDDHLAQGVDILRRMRATLAGHDLLAYYHLTGALHELVFAASGNPELAALAIRVNALSSRFHYRTLLFAERHALSVAEHETIIHHIALADEDGAERAMREHVQTVQKLIGDHALAADQGMFP